MNMPTPHAMTARTNKDPSRPGPGRLVLACAATACSFAILFPAHAGPVPDNAACSTATPACLMSFSPPGVQGNFGYDASRPASSTSAPTSALIALHGHPRDAGKTFTAAIAATKNAARLDSTLVIAPLFQVAGDQASRCRSPGTPVAQPRDIVWTCSSWMQGGLGHVRAKPGLTSFAALDALIDEIHGKYPSLKTITVFGFSAGGQAIQHYIGFSNPGLPADIRLRFVVSDPGTWLYFDAYRPHPPADPASCPRINDWKYGTMNLPPNLGRTGTQARAHYAQAEVHYMQGALDTGEGPGAYYKVLDKSCAARAQGAYRLERGLAYAAYDRRMIAQDKPRKVTVVPGCAHDVACVLPSAAARPVVFPD